MNRNTILRKWRLFEEVNGQLKTLFHGVGGSRLIPEGVWLEAGNRLVRDGGHQYYEEGFHVFASERGLDYLGRFRKERRLVAVEVEVRQVTPKPTNSSILLAKRMRVPINAPRRVVKCRSSSAGRAPAS